MDTTTTRKYHRIRREQPLTPANVALAIARNQRGTRDWEREHGETYTREQDGFTLELTAEPESIYPADGDGYGEYVDEVRGWTSIHGHDEWGGNYPEPRVDSFPLGLPYTAFRYSGVSQGDGGYFIPSEIAEQFDYYRRAGQSRSVAWDLTRAWVEQQLSDLFGSPLTYYNVRVTASREGIELGSWNIGTSVYDTDTDHIFELGDDIAEDAIDEAKQALARLCPQVQR